MADKFKDAAKDRKTPAKGRKDAVDAAPPPPSSGCSRFTFPSGAVYEGEWRLASALSASPAPSPRPPAASPSAASLPRPSTSASAAVAVKQRHGQGRWQHDGDEYSGSWHGDALDGSGCLRFASGACYSGQFKAGRYDGSGLYRWADGSSYDGQWKDGCMQGKGKLRVMTEIEQTWEGEFTDDQFCNESGYWDAAPTPLHLM